VEAKPASAKAGPVLRNIQYYNKSAALASSVFGRKRTEDEQLAQTMARKVTTTSSCIGWMIISALPSATRTPAKPAFVEENRLGLYLFGYPEAL